MLLKLKAHGPKLPLFAYNLQSNECEEIWKKCALNNYYHKSTRHIKQYLQ